MATKVFIKCRQPLCTERARRWYGWQNDAGELVKAPFCTSCCRLIKRLNPRRKIIALSKV